MPASSRHHQFSSTSWLIHSPGKCPSQSHATFSSPPPQRAMLILRKKDPTTFITETSCNSESGFGVAPASETSLDGRQGHFRDGAVGPAPTEVVTSEASVQQQQGYSLKGNLQQRIRTRVDGALASLGYGGRTAGDGWP